MHLRAELLSKVGLGQAVALHRLLEVVLHSAPFVVGLVAVPVLIVEPILESLVVSMLVYPKAKAPYSPPFPVGLGY